MGRIYALEAGGRGTVRKIFQPRFQNLVQNLNLATKVPWLMSLFTAFGYVDPKQAENIAHTAMYTYKDGEQNIGPGTFVHLSSCSYS